MFSTFGRVLQLPFKTPTLKYHQPSYDFCAPRPSYCNWIVIDDKPLEWKTKVLPQVKRAHGILRKSTSANSSQLKFFNTVCLVKYQSQFCVLKIARFEHEIGNVVNETRAFNLFDGKDIAPKFLGHLMEKERLMGILMEYIPGRHAPPEDEAVCRNVLKRLHEFKIVWNDPLNDGNFVITENGKAHMLLF